MDNHLMTNIQGTVFSSPLLPANFEPIIRVKATGLKDNGCTARVSIFVLKYNLRSPQSLRPLFSSQLDLKSSKCSVLIFSFQFSDP